jgi:hypothetical protein
LVFCLFVTYQAFYHFLRRAMDQAPAPPNGQLEDHCCWIQKNRSWR